MHPSKPVSGHTKACARELGAKFTLMLRDPRSNRIKAHPPSNQRRNLSIAPLPLLRLRLARLLGPLTGVPPPCALWSILLPHSVGSLVQIPRVKPSRLTSSVVPIQNSYRPHPRRGWWCNLNYWITIFLFRPSAQTRLLYYTIRVVVLMRGFDLFAFLALINIL